MLGSSLPQQRADQEGIVSNSYNQGVSDLNTQKTLGLSNLATTRERTDKKESKTLKTLSSDIASMMQAGNTFLGSQGAGDSSAVNQYSYALTKLGNKQRGDVTSHYADIQANIDQEEFKINTLYSQESQRLQTERNNQLLNISQWFAGEQSRLQSMRAQGQMDKSRDLAGLSQQLLNNAIAAMNQTQQQFSQRKATLESWAVSNSQNITQLRQNMQAISSFMPSYPQQSALNGTPSMNPQASGGGYPGSNYSDEDRQNQSWFM